MSYPWPWTWHEDDLSLMRWSWLVCFHFTFHLHLQSPFSLSSSSLLLSYRERGRWEMGEWVELRATSADALPSNFVLMTCGAMGKWSTAHPPLTNAALAFGRWSSWLTARSNNFLSEGIWSKYLGFSIGANPSFPKHWQPKHFISGAQGNSFPMTRSILVDWD